MYIRPSEICPSEMYTRPSKMYIRPSKMETHEYYITCKNVLTFMVYVRNYF